MINIEIYPYVKLPLQHTVFDVKWMPYSAKFLTFGVQPNGSGMVEVYEVAEGKASKIAQIDHNKGVKNGSFGASDKVQRNLATGDFEGRLRIWDLEAPEKPVYSVKAHSSIINCIDGVGGSGENTGGSPAIVTASKDGLVKVWDTRTSHPAAVMHPSADQMRRDCWSVAFGNSYGPEERHVCAGYENGEIKLFDLRNLQVSWGTNTKYGVCSLEFDQKDIYMNKMAATSVDSRIRVFDMRTRHPKTGYTHVVHQDEHKSTIWAVRHLPQNRDIFATTNGTGFLSLWKYEHPDKRTRDASDGEPEGVPGTLLQLRELKLTSQPVPALDWNPHMTGLFVTCSLDQTVHVMFVTGL